MKMLKYFALVVFAAIALTVGIPKASAQVSIGVNIGAAPICPYGYYDTDPYGCAPYGYYGSEWFVGGVFVGAGPWFHGPENFHGHVNNRLYGYRGSEPRPGEPVKRVTKVPHFKGTEVRDGRGHATGGKGKR